MKRDGESETHHPTLELYESNSVYIFTKTVCQGGAELMTWPKIEPILSLLPRTFHSPLTTLQEATVVSVGNFVVESKGLFADRILPLLKPWLTRNLLQYQREQFIAALFTQFGRIALTIRSCRNELTDSFISLLEGSKEGEDTEMIHGVLKGLGSVRSPFSKAHSECLLHWLQTRVDGLSRVQSQGVPLEEKKEEEREEEREEKEEEDGSLMEFEKGKGKSPRGKGDQKKKEKEKEKKKGGGKKKKKSRLMKGGDEKQKEKKEQEDHDKEKMEEKEMALTVSKSRTLLLTMMFRLIEREHDDPLLIPIFRIVTQELNPSKYIEAENLIICIKLAVCCALYLPDQSHEIVRRLCSFLTKADVDNPNSDDKVSYSVDKWRVCHTILMGMQTLNEKYPSHFSEVTEAIQVFLVDRLSKQSKGGVVVNSSEEVYNPTIRILANICNTFLDEQSFRPVRVLLHALSNRLHSSYEEYQSKSESHTTASQNAFQILVRTLSYLGILLNRSFVMQFLVPNLLRPLMSPQSIPTIADKLLLDQIAEIAVCGDKFAYNTVADFFLNDYRSVALNPASERSKFIHNTVPGNLYFIATHLTHQSQIMDFLSRMLKLFEKIGSHLQRKRMVERVGVVGALGVLLPILSELFVRSKLKKRVNKENVKMVEGGKDSPDKTLPKLLRSIWYFIVYFGFVDQHRVLPEWFQSVQNIACSIPVLLSEGSFASLEFEVEIQSHLRSSVEDTDNEMRKVLVSRFSSLYQNAVRDLTSPQCAYALSVLYAETMRASQGKLAPLFSYLRHLSTISPQLAPCLRAIAECSYTPFMDCMKQREGSPDFERKLENRMQFLIMNFCSPEQDARATGDKLMSGMVQEFPQLLWSRRCLNTVLRLLEELTLARSSFDICVEIKVPDCKYHILLPEQDEDRVSMTNLASKLCSVWLEAAMSRAPLEIGSILQEYVQSYRNITEPFGGSVSTEDIHLDLSVALNAGLQGNLNLPIEAPLQAPGARQAMANMLSSTDTSVLSGFSVNKENLGRDTGPAFLSALKTKSLYTGEVSGMLALLQGSQSDQKDKIIQQIVERVIQSLNNAISDVRNFSIHLQHEKDHHSDKAQQDFDLVYPKIDSKQFDGDVCRGAALLIQQPTLDTALLHAICWAPFVVYTVDSMNSGIFAWRWLLAARPEYCMSIYIELRDAWLWTVEERIGMFSDAERPPSPLSILQTQTNLHSIRMDEIEQYRKRMNDVLPHRVFIDWIVENFTVITIGKRAEKQIIEEMLLGALKRPDHFSILKPSLGIRFKFLLFCFDFLHGEHYSSPFVENTIRSGVYNAACQWFCWGPVWHSYPSRVLVEKEVGILLQFCKALTKDRSCLKRSAGEESEKEVAWMEEVFRYLEANDPSPSDVASFARTTSQFTKSRRGSALNLSMGEVPGDETRSRGWSLRGKPTEILTKPAPVAEQTGLLTERRQYLSQLTKLLQLLLGHEIDRIVTWHNPQSRISLAIPEQDLFSPVKCPEWISAKWRRYISLAWSVSPRLAFQLGVRFPFRKVRQTLEIFARSHVEEVKDDPTALPYLVARQNVQANIPELTHLLNWAPCDPPLALALLHSTYSGNPYVTQYAIRVLRTFSADTIIFYLPQLVQTVRYDLSGVVEDYLIRASQQSPLLAHQIIWNTRTIEESVEGKPLFGHDGVSFYEKATKLREGVLASMSEKATRLYHEEFDFFNAITHISELLLPIIPNDRRGRLKEELRKIPIDGCVYLPTNPQTTVLKINYERASPMQSAAKVPIMVSFLVSDVPAIKNVEDEDAEPEQPEVGSNVGNAVAQGIPAVMRPTSPDHAEEDFSDESDWLVEGKDHSKRGHMLESFDGPTFNHKGGKKEEAGEDSDSDDGGVGKVGLRDPHPSNTHWQSCIFKAGDDIRQDVLALQVIDLCKRVFQSVGLDLYLFPYRVIATAPGSGIIEVVPNAESRDRLGKKVEGKSLYEYFIQKHGPPESVGFQKARRNFMSSMAAYSVISFVLQVKDRHNGNLLVDEEGHIVHIDFGFLFDISPGGNLKFERSHFKLSSEMIELMGGRPDAAQFKWFMAQTVRGYLALREHSEAIITLVSLMMDTDFPCFTDQTIANLRARLSCEKSEKDAATFMTYKVIDSCGNVSVFTTYLYDVFQNWSNGIDY